MGFFDGLLGGQRQENDGTQLEGQQLGSRVYDQDTHELAQAYGVNPALVAEAQKARQQQIMASIGTSLLAAGQAGPVGQRGQLLSKMDLSGGEPLNKSLLNSAQMQIYAQNLKDKQTEAATRAQALAQIKKLNLTPEQQTGALLDPAGFLKQIESERSATRLDKARRDNEYGSKIEQLTGSGVPEDIAKGLASGRYIHQADGYGGIAIYDLATGKPVGKADPATVAPAAAPASPMPNVDYSKATGPSGAIQTGINKIAGFVGAEPPGQYGKDVMTGKTALESLRNRTITEMTADLPGRDTNQTRALMEQRAVDPASFTTGDAEARTKFAQVKADVTSEIGRLDQLLSSPNALKPAERQKVLQNRSNLAAIARDYDTVLGNFGQQAKPQGSTGLGIGESRTINGVTIKRVN